MPIQAGDVISDRYTIVRKLGEGRFAEVFEVTDSRSGKQLALKAERKADVLKLEHKTLTKLHGCRQICRAYGTGKHEDKMYVILELLGVNLADARKATPEQRFSIPDAKIIAAGLLSALEGLHREGYLHRDVKPANFVISPPQAAPTEGSWTLIDMGLARKYVDDSGVLLPERPDAGFRGSTTYAAAHAHDEVDQSRRDDLWGWFYTVVELIDGTLPWRSDRDKDGATTGGGTNARTEQVRAKKLECIQDPTQLITFGGTSQCPPALIEISNYLSSLGFSDEPDYHHLRGLLASLDSEGPQYDDYTAAAQQHYEQQQEGGGVENMMTDAVKLVSSSGVHSAAAGEDVGGTNEGLHTDTQEELITKGGDDDEKQQHKHQKESRQENKHARGSRGRSRDRDDNNNRRQSRSRSRSRSRDRSRSPRRQKQRGRDRRSRSPRSPRGDRGRSNRDKSPGNNNRDRDRGRRRRNRSRSKSPNWSRSPSRNRGRRSRSRSPALIIEKRAKKEVKIINTSSSGTMRAMVGSMREGGVSREVSGACENLMGLTPAEALSVLCWYADEFSSSVDEKQKRAAHHLLDEVSEFVAACARKI